MEAKRKQLQDMNVDEFMAGGFLSSEDELEANNEHNSLKRKGKGKKKLKRLSSIKKKPKRFSNKLETVSESSEDSEESFQENEIMQEESEEVEYKRTKKRKIEENLSFSSGKKQRKNEIMKENVVMQEESDESEYSETDEQSLQMAMKRLKDKDPEFFKYLEENDKKLLDFAAFDNESDNNEEEILDEQEENSEEEIEKISAKTITKKLLEEWEENLKEKPDITVLRNVTSGLRAAVQQASGEESTEYIIDSIGFNGIIQLCLTHYIPAVHKVLNLPDPAMSKDKKKFDPTKCKGWKKICGSIKLYLSDIIQLSTIVSEASVVCALMKHILYLIPFYLVFVKTSRLLLKKIITFWCTGEESVRVLTFLCIIRLVRSLPPDYLDYTLKQMYLEYVKNCKFTSPSTWPLINFMKRSLVELYSLRQSTAYQHSFVYIRQLSIHLRNAITVKKKDAFQAVYNWQYIHCLFLWVHLLSTLHPSEVLKPLIYPLTQTSIGVIKLIPTCKYLPLRFHIIRSLIQLSNSTDTFIPVLPLILEALDIVDFKKKHTTLSMKPLKFSCALKLSKSQLQENSFKDTVVAQVYELILEYLQSQAHCIGFPELVLPTVVHIKSFMKTCKVLNYCRKLKQLVDKIQENAKVITDRRKSVTFKLSDSEKIKQWENETRQHGMPLQKFYESWKKLHSEAVTKKLENQDVDNEEDTT